MIDPLGDMSVRAISGVFLGAVAGSFLSTLALRWPAGRSIVAGRSRCDGCDVVLSAWDLLPVASFAILRGRCRACGHPIAPLHLEMELAGAVIGAASLGLHGGWDGAVGALAGWLLLVLAALDLAHLWLPDRLTGPLLALGIGGALLAGTPTLADSLIGAAAGWAVLAGIAAAYRAVRGRVGIGGGDPKLLGAIGAWLGWQMLPLVVLVASMIGLGIAIVFHLRGRLISAATPLPLGTLLAAAAWPIWLLRLHL